MKHFAFIALSLVCSFASAQVIKQNGYSSTSGAVNLTGPVTSVGAATTIVGPVPASAVDLSTVTTSFSAVAASTTSLASGGATTYLRVNGSNGMTGPLTVASSATITGNAFSVGGSSFSVLGGSTTIAYRMQSASILANSGSIVGPLTVAGSDTVKGAGGLGVTYGVVAGSMSVPGTVITSTTAIFGGGNVGIGTASPSYKLDVNVGPSGADGVRLAGRNIIFGTSEADVASRRTWALRREYVALGDFGIVSSSAAGSSPIDDSNSITQLYIDGVNKRVGIGNALPAGALEVTGSTYLGTHTGTQLYYCTAGTQAGMLMRGSGTIAVVCTASTALGIYVQ